MQKNMIKIKDLGLQDGTHFSNIVVKDKETVRSVVITTVNSQKKMLKLEWPNERNQATLELPLSSEVELVTNVVTEYRIGFAFNYDDQRIIIYYTD
ncbi:hypothetical protein WOSG25_051210 [Weissella oryzae SG25]|uniref:Uncharacterized protein n=1 Tax=Weissella oryzae (strain DSM 25784 / JCM 18191 / LMG 30913 / SG25) TaxID=1329250 RepID=A0A069CTP9_WEIOS|nr:hypothetical protein [Weissella oryzae]GAK30849.1 hypothetical protein WOSG25_051210 [Weissella oryzae SG25]